MCGRYLLYADPAKLQAAFGFNEFSELPRDLPPRFNVAPSQGVPLVRHRKALVPSTYGAGRELSIIRRADGSAERELVVARWGLIPSWAKDASIGYKMINARAETAADKPALKGAFRARRAIIPASGFYEWKRRGSGPKQPYLIRRKDGEPLGFAGLWEAWTDRSTGEVVTTCTILTCAPNALMAELHDRMPVILDTADYEAWLNPVDPRGPELLRPCPDDLLEAIPVSTRVNSPKNEGPDLIQPVELAPEERLIKRNETNT